LAIYSKYLGDIELPEKELNAYEFKPKPVKINVDWMAFLEMPHPDLKKEPRPHKRTIEEVTISFYGWDALGTKYNLIKTLNIEHFGCYIYDDDIFRAIKKSLVGSNIVRFDVERDNFMGAPNWQDICNKPVHDSVDY